LKLKYENKGAKKHDMIKLFLEILSSHDKVCVCCRICWKKIYFFI